MKKFVCDICGIETKQYELSTLYDWYKVDRIEDVCESCYREIRNSINKIEDALKPVKDNWVKKVILKLKGKSQL